MKKRVFAIMLILIFLFSSTAGVFAKPRYFRSTRTFSKSYSSYKSSIKSSGSFGSSKSRSSSTKSSIRSIPGGAKSYSSSSGSSAKSFSSKSSSKKYSYMQDTYKKQVSEKNYNKYKQKLNAEQQKVYNDSMKRDYRTSSRRMSFEDAMNTRTSRINSFNKRPIRINVNSAMFSSPFSYGYAYVGPWDLWFLMRASEMFWYHHWLEILPYKNYFNQEEFEEMEKRIEELEKQRILRDPKYVEPDTDLDLQFSQEYQEENIDKIYYTDKYSTNSISSDDVVNLIMISGVILAIVIRVLSKPKQKKSHYSKIY